MSEEWDAAVINKALDTRAFSADKYLITLPGKMRAKKSYEFLYDRTLAEFWVYNALRDKARSRLMFHAELRDLRKLEEKVRSTVDPRDVERFIEHWRHIIDEMIEKVDAGETPF